MTVQLVSVIGNSPGVGKSTLCRGLAAARREGGAEVDHFEEADILTREAFRPVAEEFADGAGAVRPGTLVACMRAYVAEAVAAGTDVLVTDALLPFVPSLVAWGHDEDTVAGVVADLESAAAHLRAETELTRRVLARTPWRVVPVDAGRLDAEAAFAYARGQLAEPAAGF
ncbi:hypothetical protein [Streptomyces sp. 184]|uniref:hypothetical protein n=1 Tax=Streptomyces sp. 184 TaxID=1827526 RepID=UPI003891F075